MENTKTELNETKIKFEDTKIQLEESKIQSKETNIKLKETKIKKEETKSQLDESKIQLEYTKIQLEYSKTKTSKLDKKLADIYEYNTKDPCKNCNGSTFCLDGQVVRNTLGIGTKVRATEDTTWKTYLGIQSKFPANNSGVVERVCPTYGPIIKWNTSMINIILFGSRKFVYDCK